MIPKKIHYCWFGGNELPEKDKICIESWKKFCPDYEIIRWDESNYDITKNKYMQEAYEKNKLGFVPDYARLDIIYSEGGFYLDTDVELIRSLDDLRDNKAVFGFENDKYVNLGHGFGAEQFNPVVKEIRDDYGDEVFVLKNGELNLTPSPVYTTKVLANIGMNCDNTCQFVGDSVVFPSDYFSPLDFESGVLNKTNNTYSIHWFNMSWKEQDEINLIHKEQETIRRYGSCVGKLINRFRYMKYIVEKHGFLYLIKKVKEKMKGN